jgi:hypothetical protein
VVSDVVDERGDFGVEVGVLRGLALDLGESLLGIGVLPDGLGGEGVTVREQAPDVRIQDLFLDLGVDPQLPDDRGHHRPFVLGVPFRSEPFEPGEQLFDGPVIPLDDVDRVSLRRRAQRELVGHDASPPPGGPLDCFCRAYPEARMRKPKQAGPMGSVR